MQARMNIAAAPEVYRAAAALDAAIVGSGIDQDLLHLIKLRASQINGCAYCVNMHVKEALKHGMDAHKLHLVAAWRESPLFDERERAVLGWTDSLTRLADTGAPDEDYAALQAVFSPEEVVRITWAAGMINLWNRMAVGARSVHD